MGLYAISVSRPYFSYIRGTDRHGQPRNLLDLCDFHRRIPDFCNSVAANPSILWDESQPLVLRTLDGASFSDLNLLEIIQSRHAEFPHLLLMISTIFKGCANGWIRFTEEFAPGGSIDQLTDEQRQEMFVPATNDHNEGKLGSLRVHARQNPNSNAFVFTDITRVRTNNTECFIKKFGTDDDHKSIARRIRESEKVPSENRRFKENYATHMAAQAKARNLQTAEKEATHANKINQLNSIDLVTDEEKLGKLNQKQLYDQLRIYKLVLKDAEVINLRISGRKKGELLGMVKEALRRNQPKRNSIVDESIDPGLEYIDDDSELMDIDVVPAGDPN